MKHIKKKYLFEDKLKNLSISNSEQFEFYNIDDVNNEILKKASKEKNVIIETTLDEKILAFIYNNNGKHITIPLPDFTLVYYDFAYKLNIERKNLSKQLFDELSDLSKFSEINGNLLYSFYGHSTSCIINLFTSIESFINSMLPDNKEYVVKRNNRTELYNKVQIQENISFMDKLKNVLPQFYEDKNFFKNPTPTNDLIYKLKDLRDKIIHTKANSNGENQIELFKLLLKFKYDETFIAVKKLINFYNENYIIDCPCEETF